MLNLGPLIAHVRANLDPKLGDVLEQFQAAINQTGINTGTDPKGQYKTPPQLQGINVKAANGQVHVVLTHNVPIQRGMEYFVEADTDPSFPQPHVEPLGASRGKFFPLPGKTDGGATQHWYFRGYAQHPGGQATAKMVHGGQTPIAVDVGGTTQLTPIPSTGSGTALANGTQGGHGFGPTLFRDQTGK